MPKPPHVILPFVRVVRDRRGRLMISTRSGAAIKVEAERLLVSQADWIGRSERILPRRRIIGIAIEPLDRRRARVVVRTDREPVALAPPMSIDDAQEFVERLQGALDAFGGSQRAA